MVAVATPCHTQLRNPAEKGIDYGLFCFVGKNFLLEKRGTKNIWFTFNLFQIFVCRQEGRSYVSLIMIIDPEVLGAEIEDSFVERGGGGGGKKKKAFGGEHRSEKVKELTENAIKEGGEKSKEALVRVKTKVSEVFDKDVKPDAREVKAYFEWLKYAAMCNDEICSMKAGNYGDQDLGLEMIMKNSDLDEDFVRSQGAGGQNVNKVSSAVQLKHIPSGYFVKVQDSRDQFQNRPIAKERLLEKLCGHLNDWKSIAGEKKINDVMSEVFQDILESNGELKGARGDVLKKVVVDLKVGRNLK